MAQFGAGKAELSPKQSDPCAVLLPRKLGKTASGLITFEWVNGLCFICFLARTQFNIQKGFPPIFKSNGAGFQIQMP